MAGVLAAMAGLSVVADRALANNAPEVRVESPANNAAEMRMEAPARAEVAAASSETAAVVPAVPFGPGEHLVYRVSVGVLGGSGRALLGVAGIDTIRGRPAYHLGFWVKGRALVASVENNLQSWMDIETLASLRFDQMQDEIRTKRHRIFDFYPEERRWKRVDSNSSGELPTDHPLDDVSFLFYARTLPLEVGQTYTLPYYFKASGNPVTLKVLRRERVRVPAGTFETIVVQPIIRAGGLFGEGGRAEVYFSDDDRRLIVQMRSRLPVLGHLNLELEKISLGTLLADRGRPSGS